MTTSNGSSTDQHLDQGMLEGLWLRHWRRTGSLPMGFGEGARAAGVPPIYWKRLVGRMSERRCQVLAFRRVVAWLAEVTGGDDGAPSALILSGPSGSWKSTAAAWAVATVGPVVGGGRWLWSAEIGKDRGEHMRRAAGARLMVLDDMGYEFKDEKGWMDGLLDELVNRRYEAQAPTLVTTNLALPDFQARYGGDSKTPSRLYRRLRDMAGPKGFSSVELCELDGPACHPPSRSPREVVREDDTFVRCDEKALEALLRRVG